MTSIKNLTTTTTPDRYSVAVAHYGAANDIGGVTTWLMRLLATLSTRYRSTNLLITHYRGTDSDDFTCSSIHDVATSYGIDCHGWLAGKYTEDGLRRNIDFLNSVKPDVFLPQCMVDSHFAAKWAGAHGLPWIFTLHADYPEFWGLAEEASPLIEEGVWVGVSAFIANKASRLYPNADVRFIPYGTEIPHTNAEFSESPFTVVYCGRIVQYQKRLDLLLEAFKKICGQSENVNIIIIGDGPDRNYLDEQIKDCGLQSRIQLLGRLAPTAVKSVLLQAQAFLLMSDFEGLPVALIEAMACGLVPVVRKIESGIPELVVHEKTGVLVNEDPARAAAAICELACNRERWKRLSIAARNHISERYSEASSTQKWLDLIDELASRRTCSYPLPLPPNSWLPPATLDLARMDKRRPTIGSRLVSKVLFFSRRIRSHWSCCLRKVYFRRSRDCQ